MPKDQEFNRLRSRRNLAVKATTSNIIDPLDVPTLEQIMAAIEAAAKMIRPIGTLYGMPVYLDPSVQPNQIEITTPDKTMRFSVHHPYIKGTVLERAAHAASR